MDILKDGVDIALDQLAMQAIHTLYIEKTQTPDSWNNAPIILIHKKGDIKDVEEKKLQTNQLALKHQQIIHQSPH